MSKRKITIIFSVLLTASLVILLSNEHSRWLVFNGIAASKLSNQMLSQESKKTPDWALDYVIHSNPKEQTVFFSSHHSMHSYAYSPNQTPHSKHYIWQHLIGSWYVGTIKT